MTLSCHRYLKTALLCFVLCLGALSCFAQMALEIYQFQVGQADAALILTRDSVNGRVRKVMIIDAGEKRSLGNSPIVDYLDNVCDGKNRNVDIAIASHYHKDHIGGFFNILTYLKKNNRKIDKMVVPGGLSAYNRNTEVLTPFVPRQANQWSPMVESKLDYFFHNITDTTLVSQVVQVSYLGWQNRSLDGIEYQLDVLDGVPVKLRLVAGLGRTGADSSRLLPYAVRAGRTADPHNDNNDCLAWVLEFGKFRFYTGGDLGGIVPGKETDDDTYINQEYKLGEYIKNTYSAVARRHDIVGDTVAGHTCVMKMNHHGSAKSNRVGFLNALNASVCITSTGTGGHDLPYPSQIDSFATISKPICKDCKRLMLFTDINNSAFKRVQEKFKKKDYEVSTKGMVMVRVLSKNEDVVGADDDDDDAMTGTVGIDQSSVFTVFFPSGNDWMESTIRCHR